MHLPRSLGTGLGQRLEKAPAVQVILEDGFAAVAAIHDVIDGIGVLDAKACGPCAQAAGAGGLGQSPKPAVLRD